MTRMTKVILLIQAGCDIDYHYHKGPKQGRLFIDKINDKEFNTSFREQSEALALIDELTNETLTNEEKVNYHF